MISYTALVFSVAARSGAILFSYTALVFSVAARSGAILFVQDPFSMRACC
jgi:hypothetical protein